MGFTRSTTNTAVHQNMPDYPSGEGYTTTQLKEAFDAPATGLKTDLNGLMTELEDTSAADFVGAAAINENDTTDGTVQAKLEYLMEEMQGIALGDIPDGSITGEKMSATYDSTLAKKDTTLQEGLNAEKVGGANLAAIQALIDAKGHVTGSFTVSYDGTATTGHTDVNYTLNLGFRPSFVIYFRTNTLGGYATACFGIIVGDKGGYFDEHDDDPKWNGFTTTTTDTGTILKSFRVQMGQNRYTYNMSYIAFR